MGIPMNSIQKFTRGGGPVSVAPQHSALEANTAVASEVASPNAQFESLRKVAQKTSESLEKNRIQMESVAAELQRMADGSGRSLGFQFVQALDGPVITVSNTKTGEVIRQIPQEVVVRVAHSIDQLKGVLFDDSQ